MVDRSPMTKKPTDPEWRIADLRRALEQIKTTCGDVEATFNGVPATLAMFCDAILEADNDRAGNSPETVAQRLMREADELILRLSRPAGPVN